MTKENVMKRLLGLIIVGLIFLSACGSKAVDGPSANQENKAFNTYLDELLVDTFAPEDFSINFSFIDPEKYGVTRGLYDFGFTSEEDYDAYFVEVKEVVKKLKEFKANTLLKQQNQDRLALLDYYERELLMEDFYDYETGSALLGSSRALMGSIPAYLEKFEIHDEKDVEGLLNLVKTMDVSFQKYVDLEKTRQDNGTGYSQAELDEIITQARDMAKSASDSDYYLIGAFADKLKDAKISDAKTYEAEYRKLINTNYVDAFNHIASELSEIKGGELMGLAHKPNGKEYYLALLEKNTGSSRGIKAIESMMSKHKMRAMMGISSLGSDEATIEKYFDVYANGPELQQSDGKALIDYLNANYRSYFPTVPQFNYDLKRVHPSMEEGSSPAFYFTPQVDYTDEYKQVIFAKGDFDQKDYRTFGHEATPGHMYQFSYFMTQDSHPLTRVLSSSANAEGWANYTEQYIDIILGLDEKQAAFNEFYNTLIQILHIEMDLGINYYGWDIEAFSNFSLENFGLEDEEDILEIYQSFVHNPAAYPTYYLSNLYINNIKADYFKNNPDAKDIDFHTQFLNYGSVGFDLIEKGFKDAEKNK